MPSDRLPILTYHSIDESRSVISVSPAQFAGQMEALSRAGFVSLPLREAALRLARDGHVPDRTVVITFDDGYESVYTEAMPILARHGFKATVFLVGDFVGRPGRQAPPELDGPLLSLLSWDQVQDLVDHGHEMGAHTMSHPDLTRIPSSELTHEIATSRKILEDRLGEVVSSFAYPFGRFTPEVRQIVSKQFATAVSTKLGFAHAGQDPYTLARCDMYYLRSLPLAALLSTPAGSLYLGARHAMRQVKARLLS